MREHHSGGREIMEEEVESNERDRFHFFLDKAKAKSLKNNNFEK